MQMTTHEWTQIQSSTKNAAELFRMDNHEKNDNKLVH